MYFTIRRISSNSILIWPRDLMILLSDTIMTMQIIPVQIQIVVSMFYSSRVISLVLRSCHQSPIRIPINAPQKPNIQKPMKPRIVATGTIQRAKIVPRIKRTVNIFNPLTCWVRNFLFAYTTGNRTIWPVVFESIR